MWGGTGYVVQGGVCRRYKGWMDDKSGLARWTSVELRGAEGCIIRIVSVYSPNERTDGTVGVAAQHRNFLNSQGRSDVLPVDFF